METTDLKKYTLSKEELLKKLGIKGEFFAIASSDDIEILVEEEDESK